MENIKRVQNNFFLILSVLTDRFPGLVSLLITLVIFAGIVD
ncbi:hypothetical protein ACFL1N_04760 [Thermodesulfobacteriota bacterium]